MTNKTKDNKIQKDYLVKVSSYYAIKNFAISEENAEKDVERALKKAGKGFEFLTIELL